MENKTIFATKADVIDSKNEIFMWMFLLWNLQLIMTIVLLHSLKKDNRPTSAASTSTHTYPPLYTTSYYHQPTPR
jgi:hypothetical protein